MTAILVAGSRGDMLTVLRGWVHASRSRRLADWLAWRDMEADWSAVKRVADLGARAEDARSVADVRHNRTIER